MRPALLPRLVARLGVATLVATSLTAVLAAAPAQAAQPVPPTPSGLPAGIEALQTYVGQTLCDPVAKPGVSAFRDLVLRTYSGTTSLGIVRDCGVGGQSEHKEGRAWDWGVSVSNATQYAQAQAFLAWLVKTDAQGHTYAMVRRLGIMYMIWNKHIWKAYQADKGWQAYSGTDPHTGHVHFSFGWSGAQKATSYWDNTVAPFDPGPAATVVPVRSPANLAVVRTYGSTVLKSGSTGTAVKVVQAPLHLVVDGSYGSMTVSAVKRFQSSQSLTQSGTFGAAEWKALFPPPIVPFGAVDGNQLAPGTTSVTGWAIDADTTAPLGVAVTVDGTTVATTTADLARTDIATRYPGFGTGHGFAVSLTLTEGSHKVCATAANAPNTPGTDGALSCRTVTATHVPSGALESGTSALGQLHLTGWAVDPDTASPVDVAVTVDGGTPVLRAADVDRPELATTWPGFGTAHGFAVDLDATEGLHHVCVTAKNTSTGTDKALGCSDLTVLHTPDGELSTGGARPGGVLAEGWGLDPDVTASVPVEITVDGTPTTSVQADLVRTDITPVYAPTGDAHGFSGVVPVPEGQHVLCALVANAQSTPGAEKQTNCDTVVAHHSPTGRVEGARTVPGGGLVVKGWALDPDVAASTSVQITSDGKVVRTLTASVTRNDVATSWPGFGSAHGFSTTVTLTAGWHKVCVSALNAAGTPGTTTALPCHTVLIGMPAGHLDAPRVSTGKVGLTGWLLDPDTASPVQWVLRLDGTIVQRGTADRTRTGFGATHPGYGDVHGLITTVYARAGSHTLCLTAYNVSGTQGGARHIGCVSVTIP
jgi:peptidoglycan hydrolase-like protein with peptidoglycan-binding domain